MSLAVTSAPSRHPAASVPAVALLSSPGPESVQNRVARALANLALEPDGARDVLDAGERGPRGGCGRPGGALVCP